MDEPQFTGVAWAPWVDFDSLDAGETSADDERDWLGRRDLLATAWVQERARTDHQTLVLRVSSHAYDYREGPFSVFAKRGQVVTNRVRHAAARGATLVPEGWEQEIRGGMSCAQGTGIVVTEHPAFPLHGWAMALGALNLRTLRPTVDTRTEQQREHLGDLISMLYNGWTSSPGRYAAQRLIPELAVTAMTWAIFVGSILAAAPSRVDRKQMQKLAPKVWQDEIAATHERCMRPL